MGARRLLQGVQNQWCMYVCPHLQVDDLWHVDQQVLELHNHNPTHRGPQRQRLAPPFAPYLCLVWFTCGLVHIWTCPEPRALEMALVRDPRVGRPLSAAIRYGLGNALPLLVNRKEVEGSEGGASGRWQGGGGGNRRERDTSVQMLNGLGGWVSQVCVVPDECV